MSSDQKISIKVNLAGRDYPLKVQENEIPKIEKVVDELNETINGFKSNYGKDTQDCLSMTLLKYVLEAAPEHHETTRDYSSQIQAIHQALDDILISQ